MTTHLVLGGPGCGKTTRLLDIVEREMSEGTPSDRIAFVAFTRAAAHEARRRAAERFHLDPEKDLPWFRTIHSLAYERLGFTKDEMLGTREWREFAELLGYPPTYSTMEDPGDVTVIPGYDDDQLSKMLRLVEYASATQLPLPAVWSRLNEQVPWHLLKLCEAALTKFKSDIGKFDFSDLLWLYAQGQGDPVPVQVAIIDEAQDLTRAQWAVVDRAFHRAQRWYIGGDDDQAIYTWAGAAVERFLRLSPDSSDILPVSHRLPKRIHGLAARQIRAVRTRYIKPFTPRSGDDAGVVEWHNSVELPDELDQGSWFLLARNTYLLRRLLAKLREEGYVYQMRNEPAIKADEARAIQLWDRRPVCRMTADEIRLLLKMQDLALPQLRETQDYAPEDIVPHFGLMPWWRTLDAIPYGRKEYYQRCLARSPDLTCRIRVDTIHGVKGLEADHVFLLTDLSRKTYESMALYPDAEHRVWYVGLTRARESLHLVAPQSDMSYLL